MPNQIDDLTAVLKADHCDIDTIYETLNGVTETYNMVCGPETAWLNELNKLLPNLPIHEARFIALLLIANKSHMVYERALDLLVAQMKADPSLQQLIDALSDDDAELGRPGWTSHRRETRKMPTYEVALDDGRKIHIDADDQDAALAGAQHFRNNSPQKVPPLPSGYQLEDGAPWNAFRVSDSPGAVQINAANIKQARDQGYSDEAIANHLASVYPKLMLDHLSGATQQPIPPLPAGFQQQSGSEGPWIAYQKAAPATPPQFDDLIPNKAGNLRFDDLIPQNTPNEPVTFSGARNAFNSGVVKGVYNIPGDVMALANLGRRGYAALTGGNYDPVKDDWSLGQTYEKGRDYVDKIYTPKNKTEEWLKWGSEFLPAMATGPEGLAADSGLGIAKVLAKRAATQVAAPAIAAKVADTAAQGTPLEPYAGPAAALLAGGVGIKGRAPEVSVDAAKAATNASYETARNAGVMYDQNALASRAAAAKADLTKRGISEQSAPSAHDTLDSFIRATPRPCR